jgi:hypothetical protein
MLFECYRLVNNYLQTNNLYIIDYDCIVDLSDFPSHIKTKSRRSLIMRDFQFNDVVPPGIEPGTHGFSVRCSTN